MKSHWTIPYVARQPPGWTVATRQRLERAHPGTRWTSWMSSGWHFSPYLLPNARRAIDAPLAAELISLVAAANGRPVTLLALHRRTGAPLAHLIAVAATLIYDTRQLTPAVARSGRTVALNRKPTPDAAGRRAGSHNRKPRRERT